MTTTSKIIGEFGATCGFSVNGSSVFSVRAVHGHTAEIRKLWRQLDDAGAPEQYRILSRLHAIGALICE